MGQDISLCFSSRLVARDRKRYADQAREGGPRHTVGYVAQPDGAQRRDRVAFLQFRSRRLRTNAG